MKRKADILREMYLTRDHNFLLRLKGSRETNSIQVIHNVHSLQKKGIRHILTFRGHFNEQGREGTDTTRTLESTARTTCAHMSDIVESHWTYKNSLHTSSAHRPATK